MKISTILEKIDENQLFVPAFQREYVWKRDDAKELIDSLIKEYPTGTMLTWETANPPELKGPHRYNEQQGAVKLLLDGQQRVEFKSTLRWDVKEGCLNKKLEEVIMKTVAAFANSQGGTLLIGVADNGEILGLDADYDSLGGEGKDKFELHLRNLLTQQFGVSFVTSRIVIKFHAIAEKEICQVDTTASNKPVIVTPKDKNGQVVERFYVRNGNSSREMPLGEMSSYIAERFHT